MTTLYCACCGRPFVRPSARGPAPRYCSQDCRMQMAVRRRAWAGRPAHQANAAQAAAARHEAEWTGPARAGGRRAFAP